MADLRQVCFRECPEFRCFALSTMPENRQSALKRLWTPAGIPATGPLMTFWRVQMVSGLISASVLLLLPAAFLPALFFHVRSLAAAGIFILAVSMANFAVLEAFRIRLVLHLGRWTGWKREPIWRNEQPVRYWTRTAMHAAFLSVYAAAVAFLFWSNLSWITRR
ncbi:MAG: hypothetical protein ACR2F8_05395 [Caulobacteraceae bacterium]